MKRSVSWPLHVKSENEFRTIRRAVAMANMALTKETRNKVALVLSCLPKPTIAPGIVVTLTRISAGYLDDDGLRGGSMKAVRDGVADWLGIDDRDPRVSWRYAQQGCPLKQFGVRIDIDDDAPGPDVRRILGDVPTRLTAPSERGIGGPRALPPASSLEQPKQIPLVYRPAFARLPWDPPGVVSEMPIAGDAPAAIRMRVPAKGALGTMRPGTLVILHRHAFENAELGGSVWMYTVDAPAKSAGASNRRTGS